MRRVALRSTRRPSLWGWVSSLRLPPLPLNPSSSPHPGWAGVSPRPIFRRFRYHDPPTSGQGRQSPTRTLVTLPFRLSPLLVFRPPSVVAIVGLGHIASTSVNPPFVGDLGRGAPHSDGWWSWAYPTWYSFPRRVLPATEHPCSGRRHRACCSGSRSRIQSVFCGSGSLLNNSPSVNPDPTNRTYPHWSPCRLSSVLSLGSCSTPTAGTVEIDPSTTDVLVGASLTSNGSEPLRNPYRHHGF